MYLRKVVSRKKSGYTHTTVQLVESYRNEEGNARTKILDHFGPLDEFLKHLEKFGRSKDFGDLFAIFCLLKELKFFLAEIHKKYFISAYSKVGRFKNNTIILDTVEVKGNLFQQLDGILEAIKKNINVRFDTSVRELSLEGVARREIWDYPLDALREAVINALVHRDYLDTSSSIEVRIYDDQIILSNPGKLMPPLTIEQLKEKHSGRRRNPLIAAVFYYANLIESWGSGTLKIINLCKEQNLPEPEFVERKEGLGVLKSIKNPHLKCLYFPQLRPFKVLCQSDIV